MVIDTNIFIDYLRAKDKTATKLYQLSVSTELFISSISLYELYMGATTIDKEQHMKTLTEGFTILPFTNHVAIKSAKIYQQLKAKNQMIEFRDIFIAATCIVNDLPIVTLNIKHFDRIAELRIMG
ncbi:type II toxin-antitoxin system VapC family toxin [Mucilaginibacter sp. HD30]